MRRGIRVLGVGAAALAAVIATGGTASAASQSVSCSPSQAGWSASGATYYHTTSGYDYIDRWDYRITGQAGSTKNNAYFYQYRDTSGVDGLIYEQATADNKSSGVLYSSYPDVTIKIAASWKTYTTFVFSFDRNNDSDPSCSDETYHW